MKHSVLQKRAPHLCIFLLGTSLGSFAQPTASTSKTIYVKEYGRFGSAESAYCSKMTATTSRGWQLTTVVSGKGSPNEKRL